MKSSSRRAHGSRSGLAARARDQASHSSRFQVVLFFFLPNFVGSVSSVSPLASESECVLDEQKKAGGAHPTRETLKGPENASLASAL